MWHRSNKGFLNFYEWAIKNGYDDGLTIDRIDRTSEYCPENCRWVDYKQQNRNLSRNVWIEYGGKKYVLTDACKIANVSMKGVAHSVKRKGLSYQESFDLHLNYYFDCKSQKWIKKNGN